MTSSSNSHPVTIVGAGPAGLTAAFELAHHGRSPLILEASGSIGGISRTHLWQGNRIDIGGHRFFTKSDDVKSLWLRMMDEPMIKVPRLSRIHYKGLFYQYPLQIGNTIRNLGFLESFMMFGSYVRAKIYPRIPEDSFQDWVCNRFGARLFCTFFKTYTEKVWGIPCTEIRADWAAQRIQGLSFFSAVMSSLRNSGKVKSLIKTFDYPRLGPGMLWESAVRKTAEMGGTVLMKARVTKMRHTKGHVTAMEYLHDGKTTTIHPSQVISSMPLSTLTKILDPAPPPTVMKAAEGLKYRDFLIVALTCRRWDVFPDNWIYVHSPEVRVGRIQNFRNWSAEMVAPGNGTTLGMEYFCSRGDDLWEMDDGDLVMMAKAEIVSLGLVDEEDLNEGCVIRECNAYPVYDAEYKAHVDTLRAYYNTFANLQTVGRNGMHRYNNQDHSMLAGHHAALRLLGCPQLDPWEVNTERSYYEEQILSSEKHYRAMDILEAEKAMPHLNS